jgi:hypothetical protein
MPAEFMTLDEQLALLKGWSSEQSHLISALELDGARTVFGERHGSWFLRVWWTADELMRSAELALTNATILPDAQADTVVVSVRATASSDERYVSESVYERRRSVKRLPSETLEEWFRSAVERAGAFSQRDLSSAYRLGTPETST